MELNACDSYPLCKDRNIGCAVCMQLACAFFDLLPVKPLTDLQGIAY